MIAYENYSVSQFFVVFMAIIFGSLSAGRIIAFIPDAAKAKSSGENIIRLLEREPPIDSESKKGDVIDPTSIQGVVQFNQVKVRICAYS